MHKTIEFLPPKKISRPILKKFWGPPIVLPENFAELSF